MFDRIPPAKGSKSSRLRGMRQRRWVDYHTQTAAAAQSKSPRRIQADGEGGGLYAAILVRRVQQTFDAAASVAPS